MCGPRQRPRATHAPAWSPHADRVRDGAVARSPAASCCRRSRGGHRGGAGQGGEGRGAPEQWADGEAVVFNSGRVAPVVVDECGGVLQLEGDQGGEEATVD
jgi:hypothetical protein